MSTLNSASEDLFLPTRDDYADFDTSVQDSFRWADILHRLRVVPYRRVALFAFKSIQKEDADIQVLDMLDEKAFLAAKESQGYIHYQPNKGMSYCLWNTAEDALVATSSPQHREAAKYANEAYEVSKLDAWYIARTAVPNVVNFEVIDLAMLRQSSI